MVWPEICNSGYSSPGRILLGPEVEAPGVNCRGAKQSDDFIDLSFMWLGCIVGVATNKIFEKYGVFSLGIIMLCNGCSNSLTKPAYPNSIGPSFAQQISDQCNPSAVADAFLGAWKLKWGGIRRIQSPRGNWYRVEYDKAPSGAERVVLVNLANCDASFPLRR